MSTATKKRAGRNMIERSCERCADRIANGGKARKDCTRCRGTGKIEVESTITFVARGPFCWGKGETVEAAVKACKKAFKDEVPKSYVKKGIWPLEVVKIVGDFDYVDGMGSVHYFGELTKVAASPQDVIKV